MKYNLNCWIDKAASTAPTRYNINGVYVKGDKMAATNGKMLAVVQVTDTEDDKEAILPVEAILAARKARNEGHIEVKDDVCVYGNNTTAMFEKVDGTFPKYKEIIPNAKKGKYKMVLDGVALIRLLQAIGAHKESKRYGDVTAVHLTFYGEDKPIRLDFTDDDDGKHVGVLMPVKVKGGAD